MTDTRVYMSCCGKRFNHNNRTEAELLELYAEHIKTCKDYIEMNHEKKLMEEIEDKKYNKELKRRRKNK